MLNTLYWEENDIFSSLMSVICLHATRPLYMGICSQNADPSQTQVSVLHHSNFKHVGQIREKTSGRDEFIWTKLIFSCNFRILCFGQIMHKLVLEGNFLLDSLV